MSYDRIAEIFGPMHPLDRTPGWTDQAACKGMDPDLFLPERGDNNTGNAAKEICKTCPITDDCLDYAVFHNAIGIWGGTSGRDRRNMVSRHPKPATRYKIAAAGPDEIQHGTYNGYAQHLRRRIKPCPECSAAATEYRRNKRNERKHAHQTTTP